MKKCFITILPSGQVYFHLGANTHNPQSNLDVTAKITDRTRSGNLMASKLTREQVRRCAIQCCSENLLI
ncbi:hypothetical protein [Chryseobacterium aurantiacum]|uniref:hypothetical protein n=1 Tax=Chryseobacterium aurantiacum TaxID=2116499 RepID=UPI0013C42351|nr:hypothetical protein [Chryseobacterium aurantiacum]